MFLIIMNNGDLHICHTICHRLSDCLSFYLSSFQTSTSRPIVMKLNYITLHDSDVLCVCVCMLRYVYSITGIFTRKNTLQYFNLTLSQNFKIRSTSTIFFNRRKDNIYNTGIICGSQSS